MGRTPKTITEDRKDDLRVALRSAKTKVEFQRVLCVWLRAELDLTAAQVATAIGWSPSTVRQFQSGFLRGDVSIESAGHGGRRRAHLKIQEERALLAKIEETNENADFSFIKQMYQEACQRTNIADSTVYRMLKRHGWRLGRKTKDRWPWNVNS